MLKLLNAEWTKQRSTASFWWTSGIFLFISVAFAAIFGAVDTEQRMSYLPIAVISIVLMTAVIIITVQATMTVTTEYRFGIPSTNYRIVPQRWKVAVAKLLLSSVIAAALTFIALLLAFIIADTLAFHPAGWTTNTATTRALWALPLSMPLVVLFAQGLGWLVRNTAGAIVLVMASQFVLETLVGFIPRIGEDVAKYMPFSNLYAFGLNAPVWSMSVWSSLGIFAVWGAVLWIVGVVLVEKRDA